MIKIYPVCTLKKKEKRLTFLTESAVIEGLKLRTSYLKVDDKKLKAIVCRFCRPQEEF